MGSPNTCNGYSGRGHRGRMTIYVLTGSSYDYTYIVGCFTDEEAAEALKKKAQCTHGSDHIEIEKHELNPDIPIWINVWMDRDGTVEHTNPTFNESFCPLELDKEYSQLCGEVVAQSEAHAIHIVNERRLQLIKSGEWE